jgi:hypothetical protein
VEDRRADDAAFPLHRVRVCALRFQQGAQLGREWKHTPLLVLGRAGIEPHRPGREIDLTPLERTSL